MNVRTHTHTHTHTHTTGCVVSRIRGLNTDGPSDAPVQRRRGGPCVATGDNIADSSCLLMNIKQAGVVFFPFRASFYT